MTFDQASLLTPSLPFFIEKRSPHWRKPRNAVSIGVVFILLTIILVKVFQTGNSKESYSFATTSKSSSSSSTSGIPQFYEKQEANNWDKLFKSLDKVWPYASNDPFDKLTSSMIVSVKTGATIASERIPVLVAERRTDLPEMLFYADGELTIGDIHINDAYRNISEEIKQQKEFQLYFKLQKYLKADIVPRGNHEYWLLARYIDTQLQGQTYEKRPNRDWYMTVDDDTFVFWNTLKRWLNRFDSSKDHYFGHYENFMGYEMANGGSGYVISRSLMKKTFGSDSNYANKYPELYPKVLAGDARLGKQLTSHPDVNLTRPDGGDPIFNTESQHWISYSPMTWHRPVLTLGHIDARRRNMARQAEKRIARINARNDDVRFCDIYDQSVPLELPFLKQTNLEKLSKMDNTSFPRWEIRPQWRAHPRFEHWADAKSADQCREKCEEMNECVSFVYYTQRDKLQCKRSRKYDFTFGEEARDETTGWDMHKIAKGIGMLPCQNSTARLEAWEASFELGRIDLTI